MVYKENPVKNGWFGGTTISGNYQILPDSTAKAQSVLVAFGLTAFIVTALMLFACQTKYDFTGIAAWVEMSQVQCFRNVSDFLSEIVLQQHSLQDSFKSQASQLMMCKMGI